MPMPSYQIMWKLWLCCTSSCNKLQS